MAERDGEIRYAQHDDGHVAYRVMGAGPPLVYVPSQFVPISAMEEEPSYERFLSRLSEFTTLMVFDRRGIGSSDPMTGPPTVDDWSRQIEAVLDAAGFDSAFVLAHAWGGLAGATLAATKPHRVRGLVLALAASGGMAPRGLGLDDLVGTARPGVTDPALDFLALLAPSRVDDVAFRRWWDSAGRRGASPSVAQQLLALQATTDVSGLVATITVPTLVLDRPDAPHTMVTPIGTEIPGARLVDLPGGDILLWLSDADAVVEEIEQFVTGARRPATSRRELRALMFTDVVGSTKEAARLGDARWREVLEEHDRLVRAALAHHGGIEIDTAGDGFLSTFPTPSQAVRCAQRLHRGMAAIGVRLRIGIHCGEVEVRERNIAGLAVHLCARVQAMADPGTTWVTTTVKQAMIGSPYRFEDRGVHALKGVPEEWQLHAVAS